jgi:catechol 2,3-dioxygenase-like lactoylglutathione lyase family enzyme
VAPDWGPFTPVHLGDGVSLDYEQTDRHRPPALRLPGDRPSSTGAWRWAGQRPRSGRSLAEPPGEINHHYGGRGFYFRDPDGHLLELITAPYGDEPGSE